MKKHIFAATVAGLFSIGAFAQASTPVGVSSQAGVATQEASAPAAKHHHKKKHHKHAHHHQAASAAGGAQNAPSNDDAAPAKP
ncbi:MULTISPECIES: hypothetical protein [unclassified Paraburkholderia]|uniref:hypothetical protein n=1 Tax=unclassified Paraburkholderia TaxID=2615204 RepID=UPI000EAF09B6|nr:MULTISPECIES: hypothetical protein [unclassified Paraburkholderia]RKR38749.1 hypothetical protein B0G82_6911 [Paraburkholderia sp. BL17N1]